MKTIGETLIARLLIVSAVASIAMIPLMLYGCGPEWARWDATQANSFFRKGEIDDALYQLRDAIRKSPRDPVLKLTLAERLIEIDKPEEALELANAVLAVYPDNANAINVKSTSQQTQGNFEAALETQLEYDKMLDASQRGGNNLAYHRALAGKDLHLAKRDIENVIFTMNRYTNWKGSRELTFPVKATILASLVGRCCDMNRESLWTISQQVDALQKKIVDAQHELTRTIYEKEQYAFPVRQNDEILIRRQELRLYETNVASLLSCRALIHQDLGDLVSCQEDRLEVVELGFDSSEIVTQFPAEKYAIKLLDSAGAYLDTRGFIGGLLPWVDEESLVDAESKQRNFVSHHKSTVRDMNVAILCYETNRKSFRSSLRNSIEELALNNPESQKSLKRQEAVLLYHRQIIHERAGNLELAEADAEKIRSLGFEPGIGLF